MASGLLAFAARVQEQTTVKPLPQFVRRQAHLIARGGGQVAMADLRNARPLARMMLCSTVRLRRIQSSVSKVQDEVCTHLIHRAQACYHCPTKYPISGVQSMQSLHASAEFLAWAEQEGIDLSMLYE